MGRDPGIWGSQEFREGPRNSRGSQEFGREPGIWGVPGFRGETQEFGGHTGSWGGTQEFGRVPGIWGDPGIWGIPGIWAGPRNLGGSQEFGETQEFRRMPGIWRETQEFGGSREFGETQEFWRVPGVWRETQKFGGSQSPRNSGADPGIWAGPRNSEGGFPGILCEGLPRNWGWTPEFRRGWESQLAKVGAPGRAGDGTTRYRKTSRVSGWDAGFFGMGSRG